MRLTPQQMKPWLYSVLLHGGFLLLLVASFHWSHSIIPSLGGTNPEAEPVKATVVDQALIDQQMAMLKAQQQKKKQEQQQLEQNITDLRQQQANAQQQMNQQVADMKAQADRLAKLKAEDDALSQKKKTADTNARRKQLQDEIAGEEKSRDARLASLQQKYVALIQQKVFSNWISPPSTPDNLNCTVLVTQVPGGTVTNVQIPSCNGDDAVVQSIITAVYKSSPLPNPPDPSLFDRSVKFTFDNKNH